MSISHYLKEIGRGKDGARSLQREQACDLFGQVLDGSVTDLEIGTFCLAMRIKGETPDEMAGFLDATLARIRPLKSDTVTVVLPSYNGARKLPVLTPLLAMLLARTGAAVLIHGTASESNRVTSAEVLHALGITADSQFAPQTPGEVRYVTTENLCPGLDRLLQVRRVIGLRNSAHSLVKMLDPCRGNSLVVGSYTHPEYAISMAATLGLMGTNAMLLRGTEGEPVADARRMPQMDMFQNSERLCVQESQTGPLVMLPELPAIDAVSTAEYTRAVLDGRLPVPAPIARQVELIAQALGGSNPATPPAA